MDARNAIQRTVWTLFIGLIFGQLHSTGTVLRNDCRILSVKFRAANVLEISWNSPTTRDVISELNVTSAECLLQLHDVTDDVTSAARPERVCWRNRPAAERLVTSSYVKFQLWNETVVGGHYIVCLRPKIDRTVEEPVHDDESVWSAKYAHIPLHQPPVFKGMCTVLIHGTKATARFIEAKRTYIYKQSDRIELYCNITGWPSPQVHWCKNSQFCDNSTSVSRSQTVTISNATKTDAGTYIMFAENKYGQVQSESLTFTMAEFKAELSPEQRSELFEGVSVQLACHGVITSFPPPDVTWYRVHERLDRDPMLVEPSDRIAFGADDTLVIISLLPEDSGNYSCKAFNYELGKGQAGISYYTIHVKLPDSPKDTGPVPLTKLTSQNIQRKFSLIGTTVRLQCLFSARPLPVISWSHNGLELAKNESRYMWSPGNHTLTLRRLSAADEGTYRCHARNSLGTATYDVHLTIFDLPIMTELPKSQNVSFGDTAMFRCNASGRPMPSISWYINNSLVLNTPPYYQSTINNGQLMIQVGNTFGSCTVRCNASNDHGFVTSSAYLNVYTHTRFTDAPQNVSVTIPLPTTPGTEDSPHAQHILLPCGAITDLQTELDITWQITMENTTYVGAVWPMSENRSLVVIFSEELIASNIWSLKEDHHCFTATCIASNGLTSDNRSADICWTNSNKEVLASIFEKFPQAVEKWWPLIAGITGALIVTLIIVLAMHTYHRRRMAKKSSRTDSTGNSVMHYSSSSNGRRLISQFSVDSRTPIIPGTSNSDSVDCFVCENGFCTSVGPQTLNHKLQLAIEGLLIERDQLQLGETIGKGQFGRVLSANLHRGSLSEHVAVKTMKFKADESDMVELFLKEAVIMKGFSDNNVLHIIGVSFECDGSPMVILPYMANGDLRQYILNPQLSITILELLKMGIQVASGMQYLSGLRFVHRDLAARNCMVNDRGVVKVADFGLSRQLLLRDYYRSDCSGTTPVPVRWLAPESLEASIFTTMGDVWSYGVLLWELMTRGAVPYSDVENWQIATFVQHGGRLTQPIYCPDVVYDIMNKCWQENPAMRPSFEELVSYIEVVIQSAKPGCRSSSVFYQNITRDRSYSASTTTSVDHDQSASEASAETQLPNGYIR